MSVYQKNTCCCCCWFHSNILFFLFFRQKIFYQFSMLPMASKHFGALIKFTSEFTHSHKYAHTVNRLHETVTIFHMKFVLASIGRKKSNTGDRLFKTVFHRAVTAIEQRTLFIIWCELFYPTNVRHLCRSAGIARASKTNNHVRHRVVPFTHWKALVVRIEALHVL